MRPAGNDDAILRWNGCARVIKRNNLAPRQIANDFIEESDGLRPVTVVRNDERTRLHTSKEGLVLNNISGRYGPFQIAGAAAVAEPFADSGPTPMNHPGEELVIVQEGELVFTVAGERHTLGAGDSIHFRTQLPHSWANPRDTPARAIWLVVRSS